MNADGGAQSQFQAPTMGLDSTFLPLGGVRRIHWATPSKKEWRSMNADGGQASGNPEYAPTMGLDSRILPLGGVHRIHWATRSAWKRKRFRTRERSALHQNRPSKKEWRSMNADEGAQSQFQAPRMGLEPKKTDPAKRNGDQ